MVNGKLKPPKQKYFKRLDLTHKICLTTTLDLPFTTELHDYISNNIEQISSHF